VKDQWLRLVEISLVSDELGELLFIYLFPCVLNLFF
jgi:hypothetical protein